VKVWLGLALVLISATAWADDQGCERAQMKVATDADFQRGELSFAMAALVAKKPITRPKTNYVSPPLSELVSELRNSCKAGMIIRLPSDESPIISAVCDFSKSLYPIPGQRRTLCALRKADETE
jgi:hypothetical protein